MLDKIFYSFYASWMTLMIPAYCIQTLKCFCSVGAKQSDSSSMWGIVVGVIIVVTCVVFAIW